MYTVTLKNGSTGQVITANVDGNTTQANLYSIIQERLPDCSDIIITCDGKHIQNSKDVLDNKMVNQHSWMFLCKRLSTTTKHLIVLSLEGFPYWNDGINTFKMQNFQKTTMVSAKLKVLDIPNDCNKLEYIAEYCHTFLARKNSTFRVSKINDVRREDRGNLLRQFATYYNKEKSSKTVEVWSTGEETIDYVEITLTNRNGLAEFEICQIITHESINMMTINSRLCQYLLFVSCFYPDKTKMISIVNETSLQNTCDFEDSDDIKYILVKTATRTARMTYLAGPSIASVASVFKDLEKGTTLEKSENSVTLHFVEDTLHITQLLASVLYALWKACSSNITKSDKGKVSFISSVYAKTLSYTPIPFEDTKFAL